MIAKPPLGRVPTFYSLAAWNVGPTNLYRCDRCGACIVESSHPEHLHESRDIHTEWHRSQETS